jgi:hypothetical protein
MAAPNSNSGMWPGKQLGLPESGPRSIARIGRRLAALAIDWAIAYAISWVFFQGDGLAILGIFALLQWIFISTLSGSIGHLLLGLRVVPLVPAWIGVVKPLIRTVLLCLVVPAAIWDRDQRGLHDVLAKTLIVRR